MGAKPYASTLPLLLSLFKNTLSPHHDPFAFPSYSRNGNAIVELWIKKYKINIGLIFGACRPSVKLSRAAFTLPRHIIQLEAQPLATNDLASRLLVPRLYLF
jgi:hypothetical protein